MKKGNPNEEFNLLDKSVDIYCLFDKSRNIFINPLPIDTDGNARTLFGQLLHTPGNYAYQAFGRFDLYWFGKYALATGHCQQYRGRPRFVKSGLDYQPRVRKEVKDEV